MMNINCKVKQTAAGYEIETQDNMFFVFVERIGTKKLPNFTHHYYREVAGSRMFRVTVSKETKASWISGAWALLADF